jgi:hypothetical protein
MGIFSRVSKEVVLEWVVRDSLHFVSICEDSSRVGIGSSIVLTECTV